MTPPARDLAASLPTAAKDEISHHEIYERLIVVEAKVDQLQSNTADVVKAFNAASGAFIVLEWLAKLAKPLLWLGGLAVGLGVAWQSWRSPHG